MRETFYYLGIQYLLIWIWGVFNKNGQGSPVKSSGVSSQYLSEAEAGCSPCCAQ